MNAHEYIKEKPRHWCFIPWLSGAANTIYPYIYLPTWQYTDFFSESPSHETKATVIHEEVHRQRQREMGIVLYALRYITLRKFRFEEELAAIRDQMRYLKSVGKPFDIEGRARQLSGWEYWWAAEKTKARSALESAWERL